MKTKTLLIISAALILILGLVTPVYGRYGQDFRREDTITLSPTGPKDAGIMQEAINNYETVILEDGARAQVVRRHRTGDEGEILVNDAEDIDVADGATLRLVSLQQLNDESLYFANGSSHSGPE